MQQHFSKSSLLSNSSSAIKNQKEVKLYSGAKHVPSTLFNKLKKKKMSVKKSSLVHTSIKRHGSKDSLSKISSINERRAKTQAKSKRAMVKNYSQ